MEMRRTESTMKVQTPIGAVEITSHHLNLMSPRGGEVLRQDLDQVTISADDSRITEDMQQELASWFLSGCQSPPPAWTQEHPSPDHTS